MEDHEIARINELAKLKKQRPLTEQEQAERTALHARYIAAMKASLQANLDQVRLEQADGTYQKLQPKRGPLH